MPRLPQALRAVLAFSVALALWALARPALAAPAPFCDDRAASATAPPPTLEAPDVGIQRARVAVTCPTDLPLGMTLRHGRPRFVPWATGAESVVATAHALPVPRALGAGARLDAPLAQTPLAGVRWRIERPPRA
jgi:hypothetical protein